jgi:SAM-dependent methyltransferase
VSVFDDPAFFGNQWAPDYDELTDLDPAPAVEFLTELAGDGRVLELAVGTGRVALPLARRGVAVEGIEASAAMVDLLREKPGGTSIPVTIGDMADVAVNGSFRMVYLVFNTLYNLIDQARQVDCFRNAARVLEPGGTFVIECFVPDPTAFDNGQRVDAPVVTAETVTLRLAHHDPVEQRMLRQVITLNATGMRLHPVMLRYCWPSELDLMAQLAGLRLRERHSTWTRAPFDAESRSHISVYEKP